MTIKIPTVSYGGRIGWYVGKPNEKPRVSGGTLASICGEEDNDKSKNMIVDEGLNRLAGGGGVSSFYNTCFVGTGTSETTASMTSLQAEYSSGNGGNNYAINPTTTTNSATSAPWWHEITRTFQFPANGVDGAALTEVGFFNISSSSKKMFSRVLFRDNLGNPTTVTVLEGEQLTISYTIRVNCPTGDTTGTININGVDIGYTLRPNRVDTSTIWSPTTAFSTSGTPSSISFYENTILNDEVTSISGSRSYGLDALYSTYIQGSFERKVSVTANTTQLNGTWDGINIGNTGWKMKLDTPFTKTSDDVLSFSEFFTIRVARA